MVLDSERWAAGELKMSEKMRGHANTSFSMTNITIYRCATIYHKIEILKFDGFGGSNDRATK